MRLIVFISLAVLSFELMAIKPFKLKEPHFDNTGIISYSSKQKLIKSITTYNQKKSKKK